MGELKEAKALDEVKDLLANVWINKVLSALNIWVQKIEGVALFKIEWFCVKVTVVDLQQKTSWLFLFRREHLQGATFQQIYSGSNKCKNC